MAKAKNKIPENSQVFFSYGGTWHHLLLSLLLLLIIINSGSSSFLVTIWKENILKKHHSEQLWGWWDGWAGRGPEDLSFVPELTRWEEKVDARMVSSNLH